eukprot:1461181-Amphidinium_carterae.1
MQHYAGNWAGIATAWRSLLLTPGDFAYDKASKGGAWLVLKCTKYGCLGLRLPLEGQKRSLDLDTLIADVSRVQWFAVSDPTNWKSVQITCQPPTSQDEVHRSRGALLLHPNLENKAPSLLRHAVKMGFPSMNLTHLRDLVAYLR